jgi:hypothetical protein
MMNLTDAAHKEVSRLQKLMNFEKKKMEEVDMLAEKAPSDLVKRARNNVEYRDKQVKEHDKIWEEKIEREIEKLKAEGERKAQEKREWLRDAEETLKKLVAEKPKKYYAAEMEYNKLQEQKDKLLSQFQKDGERQGSPLIYATPPPPGCVKQEVSLPLPEISTNEYEPVSVDMSDFFREGRSDGQPLGRSYLDGPFRYAETSLPGIGNLQRRPVQYGAIADLVAKNKS